jgi:CRP-like cAMP-binding protein
MRARALFRLPQAANRDLGLVEFLQQTVLFEALDSKELGRLARIVHEREYRDGESICEHGKPGAALFVLRRGTVEVVSRGRDGAEVPLATLEPPASFEEWAAVEFEGTHWYSIRARGPVALLALGKSDVDAMMLNFPVLANKVLVKLAGIMALRLHILVEDVLGSEPPTEPKR